jgi:hypothetical protein
MRIRHVLRAGPALRATHKGPTKVGRPHFTYKACARISYLSPYAAAVVEHSWPVMELENFGTRVHQWITNIYFTAELMVIIDVMLPLQLHCSDTETTVLLD